MRKVARFTFYGLAIAGVVRIAFKHAEAAWVADPLAAIIVGASLLYVIMGLIGQAFEIE